MSEKILHECGIAFLRLLKPLEYYLEKYGTAFYGLDKMSLLMEKQHNRGQDGAGLASIKLDMEPGHEYINIVRSNASAPIMDVVAQAYEPITRFLKEHPGQKHDINALKQHCGSVGELFLGHLRYGTFGINNIENVHPFFRDNNWRTRNLVLAGNFNLTNVDEIFQRLVDVGQHPVRTSDAFTLLEKIGRYLDHQNEHLYRHYREQGCSKKEISQLISQNLDILKILQSATAHWDGAYVMMGAIGNGDAFVMRDPNGIRPAFYYQDEEFIVAASERPVIQTTMNVRALDIHEIPPAHALIVRRDGTFSIEAFAEPAAQAQPCSFERIYFSRGTDKDIYKERKMLGRLLAPKVLETVNCDFKNTVFSFIPNTASVAFRGLVEGLNEYNRERITSFLMEKKCIVSADEIKELLAVSPRVEAIAVKDTKMRTFITQDQQRDDLVAHVYDVTYGQIVNGQDTLVMLDDSIVRGTTLSQSILRILDRLWPKKIIIVSSAPQIRYPDCYGIDMTKIGDFVAFRAAIALLKEQNKADVIQNVYEKTKAQMHLKPQQMENFVREIYKPFSSDEITQKIAKMLKPDSVNAEVEIIFQSIENLHIACPEHHGDWYFTGRYPTPGGNKVVSQSFINYVENRNERAY